MKNKYLLVLLGIFFVSFVSAVPAPHAFYGEVNYSNGDSVVAGTIIAMIDESMVGESDIIDGVYDLTVESEYGGLIYFYFEGTSEPLANYTFDSFEITELNLFLPMPSPEPEEDEESSSSHTTLSLKQFCEPNWRCGDWSSCDKGRMTRTCYDASYCEYSYNEPNEVAGCGISENALVDGDENNQIYVVVFLGVLSIISLVTLVAVLSKR